MLLSLPADVRVPPRPGSVFRPVPFCSTAGPGRLVLTDHLREANLAKVNPRARVFKQGM